MKKLFIFLIACMPFFAFAQNEDLSAEQKEAFEERAKVKVAHLQDYLTELGRRINKNEKIANFKQVKLHIKEETLKLFTENGEEVTMEVSTIKKDGTRKKHFPMVEYLDNLIALDYAKVEITFADTWHISNFYKTAGNKYEATATIFQKFVGKTKEGFTHTARTKKTVKIYISQIENVATNEKEWTVLLGDVSVADTSAN